MVRIKIFEVRYGVLSSVTYIDHKTSGVQLRITSEDGEMYVFMQELHITRFFNYFFLRVSIVTKIQETTIHTSGFLCSR